MRMLFVILLCSAGLIYADSDDAVEHSAPFTRKQIADLYDSIQRGATLKQVQSIMDRKEGPIGALTGAADKPTGNGAA